MNRYRTFAINLLFALCLAGCGGIHSPSTAQWTAKPEFDEVDNPLFSARIEPQKGEFPFYAYFLLTISNRSEQEMVVDWNVSRYLFDDTPQGMLVFKGIDAKKVKTGTVPPDTISPGTVFSREIMPLQLIAWSPIKEETSRGRGLNPGMLPAGENGVRIVLKLDTGQITVPMSIHIFKTGR